jgi:hypothetical protein
LRNLALDAARCPFVLVLDVDFRPNAGMRQQLRALASSEILAQHNTKRVYAIPAFEAVDGDLHVRHLPTTKAELLDAVDQDRVVPISMSCGRSSDTKHASTHGETVAHRCGALLQVPRADRL